MRDKSYPQGMAIRGYFRSPRHDDGYIESHLDIRDRAGNVVPGYGWISPLGDGRVNVGIGLLSTSERWKGLNTTKLMEEFVDFAPKSWCISPATACSEPTGGRLPMSFSVRPRVGVDYVIAGDAMGAINPFNGEGIAYGWETGRLAADTVAAALGCTRRPRLAPRWPATNHSSPTSTPATTPSPRPSSGSSRSRGSCGPLWPPACTSRR